MLYYIHQRDDVTIASFKDHIREEVQNGKAANVERQPLIMQKVPKIRK